MATKAKTKSAWFCQSCGVESTKWVGKCPSCGEWNSFVEEVVVKSTTSTIAGINGQNKKNKPQKISEISSSEASRFDTKNGELNRVLGGGLVPGSLILIGGEPGIGKSTLALQIALNLKSYTTLYVSGEESAQQIKLRGNRINSDNENCLIVSETSMENIFSHVKNTTPDIIVIDSIQTLSTESIEAGPGSVSQIRECTSQLLRFAKESSTPVILIGHITKDGNLAGPKILEHMVDTVLQFEGDQNHMYRILRSTKNRFGSTSEMGIYEMQHNGLREVSNPSELLLSHEDESLSGVTISASIEGMRPFLIEIQALVSSAAYGTPQRSSTGFDLRRLNMLLAVLEKRAGFKLSTKDVFLNIAGGIKVNDPAIDLAVILAVLSSSTDVSIPKEVCFSGEIGLSGEIRPVSRIDQRISEAEKLGFKQIFIPKHNSKGLDTSKFKIKIHLVSKVGEVFQTLFR
ncbi:DNA repair protein RadA [Labilibaculum euxinus]|uniref:DNA repair protein RadA n=1 Tax=Labilibaculum euxinus TaxID=2686357 RepID=A0A7M4D408_9BACT|nr:DNA repair protein RadA [Labilibaculum euxinus]MUP37387.1 DNA repair protein RadA [Labilibaculum euxinus]MVB06592.1 DNA repair protein RadA [Labilibaculum euxinus]